MKNFSKNQKYFLDELSRLALLSLKSHYNESRSAKI